MLLARSERFELPTLGFEVRIAINIFNNLSATCRSRVAETAPFTCA
jgi:hypothetical protein